MSRGKQFVEGGEASGDFGYYIAESSELIDNFPLYHRPDFSYYCGEESVSYYVRSIGQERENKLVAEALAACLRKRVNK